MGRPASACLQLLKAPRDAGSRERSTRRSRRRLNLPSSDPPLLPSPTPQADNINCRDSEHALVIGARLKRAVQRLAGLPAADLSLTVFGNEHTIARVVERSGCGGASWAAVLDLLGAQLVVAGLERDAAGETRRRCGHEHACCCCMLQVSRPTASLLTSAPTVALCADLLMRRDMLMFAEEHGADGAVVCVRCAPRRCSGARRRGCSRTLPGGQSPASHHAALYPSPAPSLPCLPARLLQQ